MYIIIYKMFKSNHIGSWHPAIITFWPEGNFFLFLFFFITIYDDFVPILAMLTVSLLQSLGM